MDSRKKDICVFVIFLIMFVISAALLIATGWLVDEYGIAGKTMFWNHEGLWFSLISSFVAASVMSVKIYNRHHGSDDRISRPWLIVIICMIIFNCMSLGFSVRYTLGLPETCSSATEISAAGGAEATVCVLHDKVSRKTEAFS